MLFTVIWIVGCFIFLNLTFFNLKGTFFLVHSLYQKMKLQNLLDGYISQVASINLMELFKEAMLGFDLSVTVTAFILWFSLKKLSFHLDQKQLLDINKSMNLICLLLIISISTDAVLFLYKYIAYILIDLDSIPEKSAVLIMQNLKYRAIIFILLQIISSFVIFFSDSSILCKLLSGIIVKIWFGTTESIFSILNYLLLHWEGIFSRSFEINTFLLRSLTNCMEKKVPSEEQTPTDIVKCQKLGAICQMTISDLKECQGFTGGFLGVKGTSILYGKEMDSVVQACSKSNACYESLKPQVSVGIFKPTISQDLYDLKVKRDKLDFDYNKSLKDLEK